MSAFDSPPGIDDTASERAQAIGEGPYTRRGNSQIDPSCQRPLTPPAHVGTIDVTNIIDNMNLEAAAAAAGHDVIDLNNGNGTGNDGGAGAPGESIDQILNNVVAATSNDHHGTGNESQDLDVTGMDTSLDDILNAAHMGNPEFLDLDMDGMF